MRQITLFFSIAISIACFSQNSLQGFIQQAQDNSYQRKLYNNQLMIARANYKLFRLGLAPSLSFSGSAPSYNKDNSAITQPDGSVKFLGRSQNMSDASLSLTQPVPFTGGTVSLNSDLYRYDDFQRKSKRYNGTLFFIRLNQPLFAFNKIKWDKKIEPMKLDEARFKYNEQIQEIAYEVCKLFFDIAEAQTDQFLAETNLKNSNANLAIEKRKAEVGTSTEEKVLQIEMQRLIYQQRMDAAIISVKENFSLLKSTFYIPDTTITMLVLPQNIPALSIEKEKIIADAKTNTALYISFERKKMQALGDIARAKAQNKQINLTASYGLNNAEENIPALYRNPNNQQRFSLGFTVPIADWGKRKTQVEITKLQAKQIEFSNTIDEASFIAEVENTINRLPFLRNNVSTALSIDTISQKRYAIATRLYQLGKIDLLNLQNAETAKDSAKKNYVFSLRQFWEAYYLLKAKTLADF